MSPQKQNGEPLSIVWLALVFGSLVYTAVKLHRTILPNISEHLPGSSLYADEFVARSSPSCTLWLAESIVFPGERGVFVGTATPMGQALAPPEVLLAIVDANVNEFSPWHDIARSEHTIATVLKDQPKYLSTHRLDLVIPGLSSLLGCSDEFANVILSRNTTDIGLSITSPSAGSFSHVYQDSVRAAYDLWAGEELVFPCPAHTHGHFKEEFLLPSAATRNVFSLQGRDPLWLDESQHSICIDNLIDEPTTAVSQNVGRGAFAKRGVGAGDVLTTSPVILVDRSQMQIMEHISADQSDLPSAVLQQGVEFLDKLLGYQLWTNYCFGRPESTIMLFPTSPLVNAIHHSPSKEEANVMVRWKSGSPTTTELLKQTAHEALAIPASNDVLIEYVAIRDIQPGDEIFLNYGDEWEAAWQQHVESWDPLVSHVIKPFRHEIGLPKGFIPYTWYTADPDSKGDFLPQALAPGELAPIRWNDTQEVVTPNAYRLGLDKSVRMGLLKYCDEMGITDVLRRVTGGGNSLAIDSNTIVHLNGYKWFLQRPNSKWNSNLSWLSPYDQNSHDDYLQALSASKFDAVLDAIGRSLNMDGLVAFHLTFIAVSRSTRGYLHYDLRNTGRKMYNVIIPLNLADDTGPELDLQDASDDAAIGRYRYEYDVASLMGDDAYHATSACDYRSTKEFRMAATVYVADVNEMNAESIVDGYTQYFPPTDMELLLSWAGRHWKKGGGASLPKPHPNHILSRYRE